MSSVFRWTHYQRSSMLLKQMLIFLLLFWHLVCIIQITSWNGSISFGQTFLPPLLLANSPLFSRAEWGIFIGLFLKLDSLGYFETMPSCSWCKLFNFQLPKTTSLLLPPSTLDASSSCCCTLPFAIRSSSYLLLHNYLQQYLSRKSEISIYNFSLLQSSFFHRLWILNECKLPQYFSMYHQTVIKKRQDIDC